MTHMILHMFILKSSVGSLESRLFWLIKLDC